jgi:hypothetical protein
MAKVTGPLMSVDARGKIADTLVFMGWRGVKTVRKWLVPSNPNTVAQQAARGAFSDAVTAYRTLEAGDQQAFRVKAAGLAKTGFNLFVGLFSKAIAESRVFTVIKNINVSGVGAAGFTVNATPNTTELLTVKYGTAPGVYIGEVTETNGNPLADTERSVALTGLASGITYYFEVHAPHTSGKAGQTGIYSQATS